MRLLAEEGLDGLELAAVNTRGGAELSARLLQLDSLSGRISCDV